jgi:hypothetical protein
VKTGSGFDRAGSDIEMFRVNSVDGIVYVFDDATNAESYLNRWCKGTTNTWENQDIENVPFAFYRHPLNGIEMGFPLYNG